MLAGDFRAGILRIGLNSFAGSFAHVRLRVPDGLDGAPRVIGGYEEADEVGSVG